jgi:hypothetical protein
MWNIIMLQLGGKKINFHAYQAGRTVKIIASLGNEYEHHCPSGCNIM